MSQTYQEDPNRQIVLPPYQQIQAPPSSNSFMDYVRNHKLTVIIAIIILIALIWWFCMKKQTTNVNVTTTPAVVPVVNPTKLQVTRTRLGNSNALY
jgi:hypothetical protein